MDKITEIKIGRSPLPGRKLTVTRSLILSRLRSKGINVKHIVFPGVDTTLIQRAALKISGEGNLCVDANGRFNIETALAYGKELKQYNLFWYEEPGDPLDFYLQSCVAEEYGYPLATGENLFSHQDYQHKYILEYLYQSTLIPMLFYV